MFSHHTQNQVYGNCQSNSENESETLSLNIAFIYLNREENSFACAISSPQISPQLFLICNIYFFYLQFLYGLESLHFTEIRKKSIETMLKKYVFF